ncbi:MAG: uracil-DNA glycosylase [Rhodothermales bacterium]|nr:uracil-DNA glycosylase [Rhodothermales bacterium]
MPTAEDLKAEVRELKTAIEDAVAIAGPIAILDKEPAAPREPHPISAQIKEDSILHTFDTLARVEKYVAETVLIPLDETRINPVFGVGSANADLMVVGEAPGADEDQQGEPFVGRAGQLLNKILAAIDFSRDEVYIANILKSRPPKNRNPLPDEVESHIPILYKQIELVNPRMILCVGKVAANALLGNKDSLGSMRGKLHDLFGTPVVVTYHPAALLRNPNWKKSTWEDVQYLRDRFNELTTS